MKPSACALFPFSLDNENDCLKRAVTIEDTLLSCIRVFLLTRKGSRLGNTVGSFLPELLLQTIPLAKLPSIAGELKTELLKEFPGVDFLSVTMTRDLSNSVSEIILKIEFTTAHQSNISELSMTLPTVFDPENNYQVERTI